MSLEQQTHAVRNNAAWCDTVFRSHGRPGAFRDHIWLNRQPAPPFYPNAVTLTRDGQGAQLAAVEEIAAARAGGWGVKDSFCCLDLTPLGCALLFEADWIGLFHVAGDCSYINDCCGGALHAQRACT